MIMQRTVCGFVIVKVGRERSLAVFKDGQCIASGFPHLNAARLWCIANKGA